MTVYPTPDRYAAERPFTASAQVDPYYLPPYARKATTVPTLIPIREFKDWDYSNPQTLCCANHPDLRWYYKGPGRNLHFSFTSAASNDYTECPCPYDDLRVIVE